MTRWENTPAWGAVLAKLVELAARVERVRVERRRKALIGVIALASTRDDQ